MTCEGSQVQPLYLPFIFLSFFQPGQSSAAVSRIFHGMITVSSPILNDISILDRIASQAGHTADTPFFRPGRSAINHLDTFFRAAGSTDTASYASVVRIKLLHRHIHFAERIHGPGSELIRRAKRQRRRLSSLYSFTNLFQHRFCLQDPPVFFPGIRILPNKDIIAPIRV